MNLETVRPQARRNGCREVSLVTKDAGAAVKIAHAWSNPQTLYRIRRKPDGNAAVPELSMPERIFERAQRGVSPHRHTRPGRVQRPVFLGRVEFVRQDPKGRQGKESFFCD